MCFFLGYDAIGVCMEATDEMMYRVGLPMATMKNKEANFVDVRGSFISGVCGQLLLRCNPQLFAEWTKFPETSNGRKKIEQAD